LQNVKSTTVAVKGNQPCWEQEFILYVSTWNITQQMITNNKYAARPIDSTKVWCWSYGIRVYYGTKCSAFTICHSQRYIIQMWYVCVCVCVCVPLLVFIYLYNHNMHFANLGRIREMVTSWHRIRYKKWSCYWNETSNWTQYLSWCSIWITLWYADLSCFVCDRLLIFVVVISELLPGEANELQQKLASLNSIMDHEVCAFTFYSFGVN
jgi:hypothetical protein